MAQTPEEKISEKKVFWKRFQNWRLAVAQDPEGAGPLHLDGRRAVEEESGGRGSSPAHDLGPML